MTEAIFSTPGHPAAFSNPYRIKKYLKNKKLSEIKTDLSDIKAYNIHKQFKKPKPRNPYFVYKKREQIQMDLIDLKDLARFNKGFKYILLAIDVFTRKVRIVALKNKLAPTVLMAIRNILDDMGHPKYVVTDRGTEFINRLVKTFFDDNNIKYFYPSSEHKASYAERANRTIQELLFKYMTHNNTKTYYNILPDIEKTYNTRYHRSIKMSPNEAEKRKNQHIVRSILFSSHNDVVTKKKPPLLKIGQRVRIQQPASKFKRGYKPQATSEIFKIIEILNHQPIPMYKIQSESQNDIIDGNFYKNELSLVK